MEVDKTYKFLAGPYKGLVFKVLGKDDKLFVYNIKLAQYDRKDSIAYSLITEWGTVEV